MTGREPRVKNPSPVSNETEGRDRPSRESPPRSPSRSLSRSPFVFRAAKYTAIGFEFPTTVGAGLVLGYYADEYLGSSPWMVLVLTLLGLAIAFYRLVLLLRHFSAERK